MYSLQRQHFIGQGIVLCYWSIQFDAMFFQDQQLYDAKFPKRSCEDVIKFHVNTLVTCVGTMTS